MKGKLNRRKYKFQGGIQRIENDTPDYSSAYKLRMEQNTKQQAGSSIAATAANIAMPGLGSALQGVGAISDSLTKDAKGNYKSKGAEIASSLTNPLGNASKALSALTGDKTAAADLFSGSLVGSGLGALGMKNPFGKTTQEKVKEEAIKAEKATELANVLKRYSAGSSTDAQAALAKKGKYKVKSKQPRMIETEGREPIFSPRKADGSRDLLYYNPNDPTHEEGGVKAMVMPRKQKGATKLEAGPVLKNAIKKYSKPMPAPKKQYIKDKDSLTEDLIELGDPTGISSYDDVYRSYKNTGLSPETGIEVLGALPAFGKFGKTIKGLKITSDLFRESKLSKALRFADKVSKLDQGKDISEKKYNSGTSNLMPKRSKISLLGSGNMAVGAKQLKVNDLNNTAFSSNLTGMPSANAANKFIQPTTGLSQVARQIPEERRKEKIRTPRSHKTINPDTNRIIDPPMLYEMKPPPPRSSFNTKNDFKKGSTKVKVYR
jgi:hypothetical protein